MKARIYRPAGTAMQSGKGRTKEWILEFIPEQPGYIEPLMGWTGMRDTRSQIKLRFQTEEEATRYAETHKIAYQVLKPHRAAFTSRRYSDNFSPGRLR
ncbi:MAG: ETC complex I subunit [Caedimonas sp.]|nr:ETC complex I subunit [Caedimonas sp.]